MTRVPAFPEEKELRSGVTENLSRHTVNTFLAGSLSTYLSKIAACFALVAIISIFLTNSQEEDSAQIYAEIMKSHEYLATDYLLVVSDSLLPSLAKAPEFYDTDIDLDFGMDLNPISKSEPET